MKTTKKARADWDQIYATVRAAPGATARINRGAFAHPRDAGARPTATWPAGQIADYAIDQPGNAPLSVREFNDHFEAFVDTIELGNRIADAVEQNPRAAMLLGGALLGSAIGSSMTNKREGALVGAGLGVLLAVLMNERQSPVRRG